jgi:alkanesulfonate monooxygenase
MQDVGERAKRHGRTLDFGLRVHVVVRETEQEAVQYTQRLMSQLDDLQGERMKNRSQDAKNMGVQQQSQLRASADGEGYAEALLWTGIGRARSGCGAALVGNPDQILEKINRYMDMGIRSFIFSGYPLLEECDLFARYVLPFLPNEKLARLQKRIPPETPATPLTYAPLRLT